MVGAYSFLSGIDTRIKEDEFCIVGAVTSGEHVGHMLKRSPEITIESHPAGCAGRPEVLQQSADTEGLEEDGYQLKLQDVLGSKPVAILASHRCTNQAEAEIVAVVWSGVTIGGDPWDALNSDNQWFPLRRLGEHRTYTNNHTRGVKLG